VAKRLFIGYDEPHDPEQPIGAPDTIRPREACMKTSEMVAIIHRGIYREKDAISTYIRLAKRVKDPKAKNVLINLASDEVGHMTKLEKHLLGLLKGNPWLLPKAEEIKEVQAVFEGGAYDTLEITEEDLMKADEIKILQVAVEREIVANRFYIELAEKAKSAEAKEMFLSLAKEEELHMKILRAEIDSIGQNGFWFDMQEFSMEM
jgi:rubrerythrin